MRMPMMKIYSDLKSNSVIRVTKHFFIWKDSDTYLERKERMNE